MDSADRRLKNEAQLSPFDCVLEGERLLGAGDHEGAEHFFEMALARAPKMAGAFFNLGMICRSAGDWRGAMKRFREVVALDREDHQALFHLGEACIACGLEREGWHLMEQAHRLAPAIQEYAHVLARRSFERGDFRKCLQFLRHLSPEGNAGIHTMLRICHEELGNGGEAERIRTMSAESISIRTDMPEDNATSGGEEAHLIPDGEIKLAVFSSLNSFITELLEFFRRRYHVRIFSAEKASEMFDVMQWCDVAWFEWCDHLLAEATKMPKVCPIVCRIHRYEAYSHYPELVEWEKVDHVVMVSRTIRDDLLRRFRIGSDISVVHNGLDFSKFEFPTKKRYGAKVAYAGYIKPVKNPSLMVQCFYALKRYDPTMTFHIAGVHQDYAHELYFDDMLGRLGVQVEYSGWVPDTGRWYRDKDFVISASVNESFQYSVIEGMAMGLLPLVHTWRGCEQFYPREALFRTPDECVACVRRYRNGDMYETARIMRRNLEERFGFEKQCADLDAIITRLFTLSKPGKSIANG